MAYSKKNRLLRVIDVQEIYKANSKHHDGGSTDRYIYRELVFPQFRISERTFYEYLAEPAPRKQIADIEKAEKSQLSLFENQ